MDQHAKGPDFEKEEVKFAEADFCSEDGSILEPSGSNNHPNSVQHFIDEDDGLVIEPTLPPNKANGIEVIAEEDEEEESNAHATKRVTSALSEKDSVKNPYAELSASQSQTD